MIYIVSPAKSLDFKTPSRVTSDRLPNFIDNSKIIMKELKKLSPEKISSLMKISDKLGELNFYRYQAFDTSLEKTKEAIYAFIGEVYRGLDVGTLTEDDVLYADKHLRTLSGLYGIIKPLDRIKEYRLEMGTKLVNPKGKDLYEFWGENIHNALVKELSQQDSKVLVNLASEEYSKAVKLKKIKEKYKVVTPIFKDYKNGSYKIITIYAKKARGLMARFLIENRIENIEDMKNFESDGYKFSEEKSYEDYLVFIKD